MSVFHLGLSISRPVSHSTQAACNLTFQLFMSVFLGTLHVSLQGVAVLQAVLPLKFNEHLWDMGLCLVSPDLHGALGSIFSGEVQVRFSSPLGRGA